ncbi:MAG: hypothetical protein HRU34_17210 [Richelia sp.]|nr:hypothetical protein [Richelia sp.]
MRDDFTKFSTIYQWFQTLIHPALMQRQSCHCVYLISRVKLYVTMDILLGTVLFGYKPVKLVHSPGLPLLYRQPYAFRDWRLRFASSPVNYQQEVT